jgi:2-polyprenyl-6-methoxyphenol hydroxylase-like FAD-dependent oxidoreductase
MMKIVIVGAGISGLATYLFLKKHLPFSDSHEIRIYEKRRISGQQGAGVGVSANGLQVLKALGLLDKVLHDGSVCNFFSIHGANGWPLANLRTGRHAHEFCVSISRHALWKALLTEAGNVVSYCEVRDIGRDTSTGRVVVQLEHSVVETDLVIGADGIHSIVRNHLLGPDKFSPRRR